METLNVLILAAGQGSRMGEYSHMHKGMLALNNKAIVSHQIEQFLNHRSFHNSTKFWVVTLEEHHDFRSYLDLAHPDLINHLVLESSSSMAHTLAQCYGHIDAGPLYVAPCDGIITNIQWGAAGYSRYYKNIGFDVSPAHGRVKRYAYLVKQGDGYILCDIEDLPNHNPIVYGRNISYDWAWTGGMGCINGADLLGSIYTSHRTMNDASDIEILNDAIARMNKCGYGTECYSNWYSWREFGTEERYKRLVVSPNYKTTDQTYFINGKVIKWFASEDVAMNRAKRSLMSPALAGVDEISGNLLSHHLIDGQTPYEGFSPERFSDLLEWLDENLWTDSDDIPEHHMVAFYHDRTKARTNDPTIHLPPLHKGVGSFIHGDLQFANILITEEGYRLIDWREDFDGLLDRGDIYYDFAKLLASIEANMSRLHLANFDVWDKDKMQGGRDEYIKTLRDFAEQKGLCWKTVQHVTGLVFLNMSGVYKDNKLVKRLKRYGNQYISL